MVIYNMIKLIILDFDDTLIDNNLLDFQSFKQTSIKFNGYVPTKREIITLRKKKILAREIIQWLLKKSKNKYSAKKFWNERTKFLESETSLKYISLRPYSRIFFKKLKKYKLIVVIATLRKNKKNLELFFEKENIKLNIDAIFNLKDKTIEIRKLSNAIKIKQDLFHCIQHSYRFKPNEILSIGDSFADYHAAKKCNINHIIFKSKTELSKKSSNSIYSFKDLNFKFDSIINSNFITKNSFKN